MILSIGFELHRTPIAERPTSGALVERFRVAVNDLAQLALVCKTSAERTACRRQ
jgi:hypothetical protein